MLISGNADNTDSSEDARTLQLKGNVIFPVEAVVQVILNNDWNLDFKNSISTYGKYNAPGRLLDKITWG